MTRATAFTGQALLAAVVVAMLVGLATGWRYTPAFTAIAAFGGSVFIGSVVWFSRCG